MIEKIAEEIWYQRHPDYPFVIRTGTTDDEGWKLEYNYRFKRAAIIVKEVESLGYVLKDSDHGEIIVKAGWVKVKEDNK